MQAWPPNSHPHWNTGATDAKSTTRPETGVHAFNNPIRLNEWLARLATADAGATFETICGRFYYP